MAALTADRKRVATDALGGVPYPVAASTTIYAGACVCVNSSGYAIAGSDTSGLRFVGIAVEQVDNSSGSNGDLDVVCEFGQVERGLTAASMTQATVGAIAVISDDQTVTTGTAATNDVRCGTVVAYSSNTADVLIGIYPSEVAS